MWIDIVWSKIKIKWISFLDLLLKTNRRMEFLRKLHWNRYTNSISWFKCFITSIFWVDIYFLCVLVESFCLCVYSFCSNMVIFGKKSQLPLCSFISKHFIGIFLYKIYRFFQAERDLRVAQSEFDRQAEITKLLLEGITTSQSSHLRHLHAFVESQVRYYTQCSDLMNNLQRELER